MIPDSLKPIPDFPDYYADKEGNIYSMRAKGGRGATNKTPPQEPRKMKPEITNNGYYRVLLVNSNGYKFRQVHSLILETFVSSRPRGMYGCHGVGGKLDNSLENLYWATPKRNQKDRLRDGTDNRGEKQTNHKLNELQVRIIKKAIKLNGYKANGKTKDIAYLSQTYLAKIFNVSRIQIYRIINDIQWKHLP